MAHYRDDDFEKYYTRKTFGQVLLLDENALGYVKLTSPFGSGDDDADEDDSGAKSGRRYRAKPRERYRRIDPTPELANSYAREIARGWGRNAAKMQHLGKVDLASSPDDPLERSRMIRRRILIADLEKGRDGRKQR